MSKTWTLGKFTTKIFSKMQILKLCQKSYPNRVDMFVHQKWKESRLTLNDEIFEDGDDYVTLPPEFFDNLWQPDPYFLNSKVAGKKISCFPRCLGAVCIKIFL